MPLFVRPLAALTIVTSLLACSTNSNLTTSQQTAERLRGTWAEPTTFPGESFSMTLDIQDTTVTGTGYFSYEAGPAGMLSITGTVSGEQVDLDVTYSTGWEEHFRGGVQLTVFSGDSWRTPVGDPAPFTLKRTTPPPGATPL